MYKGKDAFVQLPTSFGESVRYKVLSFVCLTKVRWVWDVVALSPARVKNGEAPCTHCLCFNLPKMWGLQAIF